MTLQIDAALGGPWEVLGAWLRTAGIEDGSGSRRVAAQCIRDEDYETMARLFRISVEEAHQRRQAFVAAYGEAPKRMTAQDAIRTLEALEGDPKGSHTIADTTLCTLLEALGYPAVVAAYKAADHRIGFRYA